MGLVATLYKNCCLNETYQNVFSLGKDANSKSVLEKYLATLGYYAIDIPNVYYENKDEFVFDQDLISGINHNDIYSFNYIKFEEYDDETRVIILIRYCFIQKISLKKQCVYLEYTEDVWSSYSDKIAGITESYMSGSRVKNYSNKNISLISLPYEYDGNNELLRTELTTNPNLMVKIIIEVQYYILTQQGEQSVRRSHFFIFSTYNTAQSLNTDTFEYHNALGIISTYIIPAVSNSTITDVTLSETYNFVIGKVYLVPFDFSLPADPMQNIVKFSNDYEIGIEGRLTSFGLWKRIPNTSNIKTSDKFVCKYGSVSNNYKNYSIGFYQNNIKVINNGTAISYSIIGCVDQFAIHFYLECMNQIIEITECFICEVPFSIITSEELSQQRIALELKNMNYSHDMINKGFDIAEHTGLAVSGALKAGVSVLDLDFARGARNAIAGAEQVWVNSMNLGRDISNMVRLSKEKAFANAPIYSYNKGTFVNNANKLNSIYGVGLFRIDSDNDEFVKKSINNFGYKVYEFIDTTELAKLELNGYSYFNTNNIHYNVVKFENANLYGSFPREIANELNMILINGVKIWYDYTMTEDNYVV